MVRDIASMVVSLQVSAKEASNCPTGRRAVSRHFGVCGICSDVGSIRVVVLKTCQLWSSL